MSLLRFDRGRNKGEILKAERMLVRVEQIDDPIEKVPEDYNEGTSMKTRLKRAWREYYVVARQGQNDSKHVVLHIHKSRVISPESPMTANCSEFQLQHIDIRESHHDGKSI
jgi:hypothetical protein